MNDRIKVIPVSEFPRRKGSREMGELAAGVYAALIKLKVADSLEIECGCGDIRHCSLRCAVLCWAKRRGIKIQTAHGQQGHLHIRLRPDEQAH